MSTRGTILDTLATQLETILPVNGYTSTTFAVHRDMVHGDEVPSEETVFTIIDSGPDDILQYCSGGIVRSAMAIAVRAFVPAPDSDAPPTEEIDDVIGDVRELVFTPIALGSNVRFVEMGPIPEVTVHPGKGIINFALVIVYWWDSAAP